MAKNSGVTVIELLVTISVLAMLSAIVITYSRSGERQIALLRDQARVINAILRSKVLATQTYVTEEEFCGYGIHFSASGDFIIFKDLALDCSLSDQRYSGAGEEVAVFKLDSNLKFSQLEISDVLFIPPDPTVIIDGDPNKTGDFLVELDTISGGNPKSIKINNFGQVSAQ